jgi:hypothetical protein
MLTAPVHLFCTSFKTFAFFGIHGNAPISASLPNNVAGPKNTYIIKHLSSTVITF